MSFNREEAYRVHGYCFVPCAAEVVVRASSEAEALEKANAIWANRKMEVIDGGSCDYDAAFDWQPSAELLPSTDNN